MEMVRVTPARIYPVSAFISILYTGQQNLKKKENYLYLWSVTCRARQQHLIFKALT